MAVLHPSALGAFCHIQLHSSFPFSFSLSFPIWSCRKLGVRRVNMLSGAQIQDLLLLGAPCLHRSMSCIRWWCCWGGGGVSRESNGRLNSIRGTNAPHSLNAVIQLQAEPRWPACCDFMCLRGGGGECLLCRPPTASHLATGETQISFIYRLWKKSSNDSLTSRITKIKKKANIVFVVASHSSDLFFKNTLIIHQFSINWSFNSFNL